MNFKITRKSTKKEAMEAAKELSHTYKIVKVKIVNTDSLGKKYHIYYGGKK